MNHPAYSLVAAICAAVFLGAFESHLKRNAIWKETVAIIALMLTIELVFQGLQP
jgi:hypothetical protein